MNRLYYHLSTDGYLFWLVSHPEGSRFNPQKHLECQEFARKRKLPELEHLLVPRVKGFVESVRCLREVAPALVDFTVAYSRYPGGPVGFVSGGKPIEVHIHIYREETKNLPFSDKEIASWLYNRYKEKDKLMAHFKKYGHFPGKVWDEPYDARKKEIAERGFIAWVIGHTLLWIALYHAYSFVVGLFSNQHQKCFQ